MNVLAATLNIELNHNFSADFDFKDHVSRCLNLPANYATVVTRAQLAQQMHEMAKEECKLCERLVYEQHLQQQGWAAVIANMEDLADEFRQRFTNFYRCFDDHLHIQAECLEFLECYSDALNTLAKIPISSCLLTDSQHGFNGFDDFFETNDSLSGSLPSEDNDKSKSNTEPSDFATKDDLDLSHQPRTKGSLLHWITMKKTHTSVCKVAENCASNMKMFDDRCIQSLKEQVENTIKSAEQVCHWCCSVGSF